MRATIAYGLQFWMQNYTHPGLEGAC